MENPLIFHIKNFVRANLLVLALFSVGMICLFVGLIQFFLPSKSTIEFQSGQSVEAASTSAETEIMVDVSGEVENPGVYRLPQNARFQDALVASGGLGTNANREYVSKSVNLAQRLSDGMKIYIPRIGEEHTAVQTSSSVPLDTGLSNGLISINSASQGELESLSGVGPVTAQKIVSSRPYASIEELVSKKAIGQSLYGKIKDQISL